MMKSCIGVFVMLMNFGLNRRIVGFVIRKTSQVIKGVELLAPLLDLQGWERGWNLSQWSMVNDVVNPTCVTKPPERSRRTGFGELLGW